MVLFLTTSTKAKAKYRRPGQLATGGRSRHPLFWTDANMFHYFFFYPILLTLLNFNYHQHLNGFDALREIKTEKTKIVC